MDRSKTPVRIMLNIALKDNYAFFCPVTLMHLKLTNPVGFTNVLSEAMLRGLRAGTLIDVDHKINTEKGCFIENDKDEKELKAKTEALKKAKEEAEALVLKEAQEKADKEVQQKDAEQKTKGNKSKASK